MTRLRRIATQELEQAARLRKLYPPEPVALAPAVEGKPVELQVVVRNTVFDRLSVGFTVDGVFAGEEPYVPLGLERRLGELAMTSGDRTLGVQIVASGAFFNLTGPVRVPPEGGELVIDVWNRLYPPRLSLEGRPLNPAPGQRLQRPRAGPCPGPGPLPLFIIDRDARPGKPERIGESLQVWIDDVPVVLPAALDLPGVPVLHHTRLSPGAHRVRIGDPVGRRILLDGDILMDGAGEARIEIAGRKDVFFRQGGQIIFQANGPVFQQNGAETGDNLDPDREVCGVPIPVGAEGYLEEIAFQARYCREMAKNYQAFLELRERALGKRKRLEPLTLEELEAADIEDAAEVQEWVKRKKKAEFDWDLGITGSTDGMGHTEFHGPPPTNPYEVLDREETLHVHEASHAADVDLILITFGIDLTRLRWWDRLVGKPRREMIAWIEKAIEAMEKGLPSPPQPPSMLQIFPTKEQQRAEAWFEANKEAILRYWAFLFGAEFSSQSEIREYTAGAEFWEAVHEYLRRQGHGWVVSGLARNVAVGESVPIRIEQIPDAPPQVRVIDGDVSIEISPTKRTHSNSSTGWGEFEITVTGRQPGTARIELTCGTLRKVVVINVR